MTKQTITLAQGILNSTAALINDSDLVVCDWAAPQIMTAGLRTLKVVDRKNGEVGFLDVDPHQKIEIEEGVGRVVCSTGQSYPIRFLLPVGIKEISNIGPMSNGFNWDPEHVKKLREQYPDSIYGMQGEPPAIGAKIVDNLSGMGPVCHVPDLIHTKLTLADTLMSGANMKIVAGPNELIPVTYENVGGYDQLLGVEGEIPCVAFNPLHDAPVTHGLDYTEVDFQDLDGKIFKVRMDRIFEMPSTSPDAHYSVETNDFREALGALEVTCDMWQEMFRKYSRLYRLTPQQQCELSTLLNKPDMTAADFSTAWQFLYCRYSGEQVSIPMQMVDHIADSLQRNITQAARRDLGLMDSMAEEEPYETELHIALACADTISIDGGWATVYANREGHADEVIIGVDHMDGDTYALRASASQKITLANGRSEFSSHEGKHELILCRDKRVTRNDVEQLSKGLASAFHPQESKAV